MGGEGKNIISGDLKPESVESDRDLVSAQDATKYAESIHSYVLAVEKKCNWRGDLLPSEKASLEQLREVINRIRDQIDDALEPVVFVKEDE